jgi:F0F1-type ATP synthase delta subunit
VTVTSALPLTNREQDRVAKSIDAENVTYQVDPRILGGLIVRVGDQVVDGSVQAQISSLRDSLQ